MNGAVNSTHHRPPLRVLVVAAIRENAPLMVHELMHIQLRFTGKRVETETDYPKQLQEFGDRDTFAGWRRFWAKDGAAALRGVSNEKYKSYSQRCPEAAQK